MSELVLTITASDALYRIFQQEYGLIRKYLEPKTSAKVEISPQNQPKEGEETLSPAEQQRQGRMDRAKQLHELGCSQKEIAHQLGVHPKTIRRFRDASGLPPRIRTGKAEPLSTDPTRRPPTLRTLTFAIMGRPEQCAEEHHRLLEQICVEQPQLGGVISQAKAFAALVRQQQTENLQDWLAQSQSSAYQIWKNFAVGIEQDRQAVQAALTHTWSNGPTEGYITRLKCLKRLMYGRASDELLRKRVLWQGKWGFT